MYIIYALLRENKIMHRSNIKEIMPRICPKLIKNIEPQIQRLLKILSRIFIVIIISPFIVMLSCSCFIFIYKIHLYICWLISVQLVMTLMVGLQLILWKRNFLSNLLQCYKSFFIYEKILSYVVVEILGLFKK